MHAIRRNVNMVYVIENNGVYGLTKGQLSASADIGSSPKKGEPNLLAPIDPIMLGLTLGATFLARCFSGDKEQLIPILKAAVVHHGFALIDVISPCVTFNDHESSTKSYKFFREHEVKEVQTDFVPLQVPIRAKIPSDEAKAVTMHDGSVMRFRSVPEGYDPSDRMKVEEYIRDRQSRGEIATGLLYLDEAGLELHELNHTPSQGLNSVPFATLCPGAGELATLQEDFR
jgi:2-oxoglutarate ferredoxin oxidoreductase subunit beta